MTEDRDYLWDLRGPTDPFLVDLERQLAPLDDAEALLHELDLADGGERQGEADEDDGGQDDGAVVLILHQARASEPAPRRTDAPPPRSWPWLAAAIAILGLSVGVLATESQPRRDIPSQVQVGGHTRDGHVVITAPDPSLHALLRPAHESLSTCALGLAPGDSIFLSVTIDAGSIELSEPSAGSKDSGLRDCLVATFAVVQLAEPTTIEVELHGPARVP